jgi:hypothetical protein
MANVPVTVSVNPNAKVHDKMVLFRGFRTAVWLCQQAPLILKPSRVTRSVERTIVHNLNSNFLCVCAALDLFQLPKGESFNMDRLLDLFAQISSSRSYPAAR